MRAFLFPGQGSQRQGMGQALFDSVAEYAAVEPEVDALLGYSVRFLCTSGPESRLQDTQYTQPCLFIVNALHYDDERSREGPPDAVAGHSLGEYNALMAAGAFDFLTGVRLVAKRAELMASAKNGGMMAVMNVPAADVERLLARPELSGLDVANYNTPAQTVIAGPLDQLARAASLFERQGASCMLLRVSAAFHSRCMADAADRFARFLETIVFDRLTLPVISNVTGRPYPADANGAVIRRALAEQMVKPVRWEESIRHLRATGVSVFREIGPGSVLTRLFQQIERQLVP